MPIGGQVGPGKANASADVALVQTLLARHAAWLAPGSPPAITGKFDDATGAAITKFQRDAGALLAPDGVVDPGGFTLRWLEKIEIPKPAHAVFAEGNVAHIVGSPSDLDYTAAAKVLNCEVAAIQAVAQTESGPGAWDTTGRPKVLFERHKFSKHSKNEFDKSHSDLSDPKRGWYAGVQHRRLKRAATLSEAAALKSASWGAYQILGENYAQAGFGSVEAFVTAQMEGERRQLEVFAVFVRANPALLKSLRDKKWQTFARLYNGPDYKVNDYDTKMATAYKQLAPPPPPNPRAGPPGLGRPAQLHGSGPHGPGPHLPPVTSTRGL